MINLTIENIGKQYKRDTSATLSTGVWGLRGFNLALEPGVLGLLGPNGAGKSTLMRILATITQPTEGQVLWNGRSPHKHPHDLRQTLGYLPQDFGVYPNLNAVEFLAYIAALKGLSGRRARRRIDELLQLLNLEAVAKRPLGGYSGGMKQRVGIAQALLNDPQLLIVDEPTVGLDPEERVRFRSLIADLSGERIVILSTHIVSDVEATATCIAIMNQGHLIIHALPEQLLQAVEGKVWQVTVSSERLAQIRQQHIVSNSVRRSDGVQVRLVGEPVDGAAAVSATLEDAYLYFVNGGRS